MSTENAISDAPEAQKAPRAPQKRIEVAPPKATKLAETEVLFDRDKVEVHYGSFRAVRGVTMKIHKNEITAFIGPSGCGKTTVLRGFNRMHDVIPGARRRHRPVSRRRRRSPSARGRSSSTLPASRCATAA